MNSIKKPKNHETFPRVRKRNSVGSKAASHSTLNAAQRRASLLKNNKNLAITLQETRCELSLYKDYFEESRDYINKAKLAKSRMEQLSATLKDFLKAFDENILLLDFDESKWPIIKASAQTNKIFQNGMNPVIEVCDEILEEVAGDKEMDCNEENNLEYADQMVQNPSNILQKNDVKDKPFGRASKSPQKKSKGLVETDKNLELHSEIQNTEGNEDISREASNSQKKCPVPDPTHNPLPAPLSSQAIKTTKIPRCRPLSANLKRQNFIKEPKPPNKASKRKSFDKKYGESDPNFSRRKTFVVKNSNVLSESESIGSVTDENRPLLKERLNVPEDELVSNNDKRKTFVLKSNKILKETEPVLCLNKIDKELVTESKDHGNETPDICNVLVQEKNKRKTFVKKSSNKTVLLQNDDTSGYQASFPIRECAVNLEPVENLENSDQCKNINFSDFHHSKSVTVSTAVKSKQISAESSKKLELNAEDNALNMNISDVSSKEMIQDDKISTTGGSASDKTEVTAKNFKSKAHRVEPDPIAEERDTDIMNEGLIFSDNSQKDESSKQVPEFSPVKTRRSFLESSESEMDLILIDEFDFGDKRPFKTTPIRRKIQISKKKKFVFDGNKRNSEIDNNHSQKNMDVTHSDVNAANNNEIDVGEIKEINDVVCASNEDPINIPPEPGTVRKKTTKISSRKIKSSLGTPVKKNKTEKNGSKSKKIKNYKQNEFGIEIDDLLSHKTKKIKKKNTKKKKKGAIYDDDNAISKFEEADKNKLHEIQETETELDSDFPCKKTGKNTFLVRAEIHPPPPSFNEPDVKEIKNEDDKLNLQHMQVTVVLNDVLKSKNLEHFNISDRDIINSRAASVKSSLSGSSSSFVIDPEESIEKLRCDLVTKADDCDLHIDTILDFDHPEAHNDPIFETENTRGRRKKPITYKEPSLNRKLRRC